MSSRRRKSRTGPSGPDTAGQGQPDRRTFVMTAAGVVAAVAGFTSLPGCEGTGTEPPTPPPGTGTLRAVVNGLGTASTGGFVTITNGTDTATLPMPAPVNGTSTGDLTGVPPGDYTATYLPPTGFELVDPTLSPSSIHVDPDSIQTFTLDCQAAVATGGVSVAVTGLTGASAGGNVSAQLSDGTGTVFTLALPAPSPAGATSGVLTGLPPGTYGVSYTAPVGFQLTNPGSSPSFVTVTVGGTANTAFACRSNPVGALLFVSDWSTAVGSTSSARLDSSKAKPWTAATGGQSPSVVAAPTTDPFGHSPRHTFPAGMTNVLRVTHHDNGSNGCVAGAVWVGGMPVPSTGETYFYRMYLRVDYADDEGNFESILNSHHPVQNNDGGTNVGAWNWLWASKNNGTFAIKFAPLDATFPKNRWIPCNASKAQQYLAKGTVYRIEWALTKTGTDRYTMDIRIYDNAGTLLFNSDGVGTTPSGNAIRDASSDLTLAATGTGIPIEDTQQAFLYVGTNGSNMRATQRDEFSYYGGVMVRSDTWCGAF
jgi:hypothetical protein